MLEILSTIWSFVSGVLGSILDICLATLVFAYDLLYNLHVNAPRLEGLLVGVLLAWLLLKREKHPLLRVLSSPLKIVLDILDLLWDQVVEIVTDVVDVVMSWIRGALGWVRGKVVSVWNRGVKVLESVRAKLKK